MVTLWAHLLFKDMDLKDYYESKKWILKKECYYTKKLLDSEKLYMLMLCM